MVPVDEVYVRKFAQIQLAVLDGQGLAAAEEYGAQVGSASLIISFKVSSTVIALLLKIDNF